MKLGDILPVKNTGLHPCPKCGDNVFKTYPTGYVIESTIVVDIFTKGIKVRNEWHCPACGLWKPEIVEIKDATDSSDKSKGKR